ncbi:trypsin-like peptidase domain-containing protein [Streptomyces actinomycinicus]|uniref:Trypsin-like peptidase domain-containing protein n=1 Tax=Streptomyces actinomycinicus TaxID=1695166 RepID=A0A937JTV8_9ACTN|nr:trypsin-like peptidase domain-containing protein [Streptomyces actinomycinicus]MBL1087193.1 trypsin-like peptidase domain-containing protein [Streptomyces actinomycinicus]
MDASRTRALRTAVVCVALVCCAALAGGCTGPAAGAGEDTAAATRAAAPMSAEDLEQRFRRVIKEVLPSVVQIQGRHDLGSGVVYDDKGHIVTNAHVVGTEKTFQVTTANSEEPLTASLVYSYPEQDLAVIRLNRIPAGLRPAVFGDSDKVEVGKIVLAMGSPLGLSSSVTQGIVSATGRTVSEGDEGGGTGATIANMVQTSADINPGNSGGALVDLDGQVIGIPTLAAADPSFGGSAAPGIGFAIPASMVRTVADQIIREGKVVDSGRAALGITARTVVDDQYRPAGVAVVSVVPGGAADKAGLQAGDIITAVGDEPITTITSLSEALAAQKPGQRTSVTFEREGDERKTEVTLGEQ